MNAKSGSNSGCRPSLALQGRPILGYAALAELRMREEGISNRAYALPWMCSPIKAKDGQQRNNFRLLTFLRIRWDCPVTAILYQTFVTLHIKNNEKVWWCRRNALFLQKE